MIWIAAECVTVNIAAALFQWHTVPQPTLNTPTLTVYVPCSALVGGVHDTATDRA